MVASQLVVRAIPPFLLPAEAERTARQAEGTLDGPELLRARAMEPAARARFLAGRLAQRLFAAELLSIPAADLTAAYSCPRCGAGADVSHGRPGYSMAARALPLALSLSRAAGWTLLAAVTDPGPDLRLGVDIEEPSRAGFAGFSALALTPAEQHSLEHLAGPGLLAGRARLWARKEAWLKMTGDGLRIEPAAVDVLQREGVRDLAPAETGLPAELAAAVAVVVWRR